MSQRKSREMKLDSPLEGSLTYVDTSVWIALIAHEASHLALQQWLVQEQVLCCADWTQLEMASALGIKYRRGEFSMNQAQHMCAVFASMLKHQVREIPVISLDIRNAVESCLHMDSGLRAGDALHLVIALRYQCSHFFSLDKNLNRNAELAGLQLIEL